MNLNATLEEKKNRILQRWISLTVETYPADVVNFLKMEKDRFANPVGFAISTGCEILFHELTCEGNRSKIITALDSIIRIRTVQDFSPSQAVEFIYFLKKAVREELKINDEGAIKRTKPEILEELALFETRIDDLASLACKIYDKCREDINRIKMKDKDFAMTIKNRLARVRIPKGEK